MNDAKLRDALIGDRRELYLRNAEFHYAIDWMVQVFPSWVDTTAEACILAVAERDEAVRLMRERPVRIDLSALDPPEGVKP